MNQAKIKTARSVIDTMEFFITEEGFTIERSRTGGYVVIDIEGQQISFDQRRDACITKGFLNHTQRTMMDLCLIEP